MLIFVLPTAFHHGFRGWQWDFEILRDFRHRIERCVYGNVS
jgi:hypothetical protein